jgi:hypothetical protein
MRIIVDQPDRVAIPAGATEVPWRSALGTLRIAADIDGDGRPDLLWSRHLDRPYGWYDYLFMTPRGAPLTRDRIEAIDRTALRFEDPHAPSPRIARYVTLISGDWSGDSNTSIDWSGFHFRGQFFLLGGHSTYRNETYGSANVVVSEIRGRRLRTLCRFARVFENY